MVIKINPTWDLNGYKKHEYYAESVEELSQIPLSAPVSSVAMVLTNSGLTVYMKNSQGEWIEL